VILFRGGWQLRGSETLLNVGQLAESFSYQLHIHHDGETHTQAVDLPETFNYLLGLDVQTRKVYDDKGRRYLVYHGVTRNGRTLAVIWRETEGWWQADFERERDFVAVQNVAVGADGIFR
jgi:adenine-specific DNA-methyltransferase